MDKTPVFSLRRITIVHPMTQQGSAEASSAELWLQTGEWRPEHASEGPNMMLPPDLSEVGRTSSSGVTASRGCGINRRHEKVTWSPARTVTLPWGRNALWKEASPQKNLAFALLCGRSSLVSPFAMLSRPRLADCTHRLRRSSAELSDKIRQEFMKIRSHTEIIYQLDFI